MIVGAMPLLSIIYHSLTFHAMKKTLLVILLIALWLNLFFPNTTFDIVVKLGMTIFIIDALGGNLFGRRKNK